MTPPGVLGVFAHPDDESLVAGGTLAACAAAGCDVSLLCLTRGERGPSFLPSVTTPAALAEVREAELHVAAATLGVRRVECLQFPDGGLPWLDAALLENAVAERVRRLHPDLVITFGPEGLYRHPDHVAVHAATLAAIDRLAACGVRPAVYLGTLPEGRMEELVAAAMARGLPADLWGLSPSDFGAPPASITTVLDIRTSFAQKIGAMRAHRSQVGPEHLFAALPDDLAAGYLGFEYFVRWRVGEPAREWPHAVVVERDLERL